MSNIVNGSTGVTENIGHTHGEIIDFTIEDDGSRKIIKIYPVTKTSDSSVDILVEEEASTKYEHLITLLGLNAEDDINTDIKLNAVLESLAEVGMRELSLDDLRQFMDTTNSDSLNDGDKIATAKAVYNAKINTKKEIMNNIRLNGVTQTPEKELSIYTPETDGEGVPYRNKKQSKWEWGKIDSDDINTWNTASKQVLEGNQDFFFINIPDLTSVTEVVYTNNKVFAIVKVNEEKNYYNEIVSYDDNFKAVSILYKGNLFDHLHNLQFDDSFIYFQSTATNDRFVVHSINTTDYTHETFDIRDINSDFGTDVVLLTLIKCDNEVAAIVGKEDSYEHVTGNLGSSNISNGIITLPSTRFVGYLYLVPLNGHAMKPSTVSECTVNLRDIDELLVGKSFHVIYSGNRQVWLSINEDYILQISHNETDNLTENSFSFEGSSRYIYENNIDCNTLRPINTSIDGPNTSIGNLICYGLTKTDDDNKMYPSIVYIPNSMSEIKVSTNKTVSMTFKQFLSCMPTCYTGDNCKTMFFGSSLVVRTGLSIYETGWFDKFSSLNLNDYGLVLNSDKKYALYLYKSDNSKYMNVALFIVDTNSLVINVYKEENDFNSEIVTHNITDMSALYTDFAKFNVNGNVLITSNETSYISSVNKYTTKSEVYDICKSTINPYLSMLNKDIGKRIVIGVIDKKDEYSFTPDYLYDSSTDTMGDFINRILTENSGVIELCLLPGYYSFVTVSSSILLGKVKNITGFDVSNTILNLGIAGRSNGLIAFTFESVEFKNITFQSWSGVTVNDSYSYSLSPILSFKGLGKDSSNVIFNNCKFSFSFTVSSGDNPKCFGNGYFIKLSNSKFQFENCDLDFSLSGPLNCASIFSATDCSININNSDITMDIDDHVKVSGVGRGELYLFDATSVNTKAINFIDTNINLMKNSKTTQPVGLYLFNIAPVDHTIDRCNIYAYEHGGTERDGSTFNSHINNSSIELHDLFYTGEIDISRNVFKFKSDSARLKFYGHTSSVENTFFNRNENDISFDGDFERSYIFKHNRVRVLPKLTVSTAVIFDENFVFKPDGNDVLNPDNPHDDTNYGNTVTIQYASSGDSGE